jgi:hypothetical protein
VQNLAVYRFVTGIVSAALFVATPVVAQRAPRFASPFLPETHWSVAAARRVSALGLAPRQLGWSDGSLTQAAVGFALFEASTRARTEMSPLGDAVTAEWHRFAREFPAVAVRIASNGRDASRRFTPRRTDLISSSVTADFVSANGRLRPVRSLDRTRENVSPPEPLSNLNDGDLELRIGSLAGRHLAGEVAGGRDDGDWRLRDWHALATFGSLGAWVGERGPDFGPGAGGGLVFDGRTTFAGGGIALVNPIRLPSVFRLIGPVRAEAFLSRMDSSASTRHPWLFASHVSLSPHPRLQLGATQAFMFSGSGLPPFTWRNFKEMFLTHGIKAAGSEFENGIASVEARWRPPIPTLPAVLYAEWAADDNHSAWFEFPAVVAGVELPALPFAPAVSLGLERTSFAAPCSDCNGCACEYYATWYRHYVFMDGWTVDRQPIGHPLGGAGTEWLLYGRVDDASRRVRFDWRAFTRDRGRFNIYSPAREGRSFGGRAGLEYRLTGDLEVRGAAELERGRGDWTASSVSAGLRWVP